MYVRMYGMYKVCNSIVFKKRTACDLSVLIRALGGRISYMLELSGRGNVTEDFWGTPLRAPKNNAICDFCPITTFVISEYASLNT